MEDQQALSKATASCIVIIPISAAKTRIIFANFFLFAFDHNDNISCNDSLLYIAF